MKKYIKFTALLIALMLLSGCAGEAAETSAQTSATTDAIAEKDDRFVLAVKNSEGTVYTSYDNGESWELDGISAEKPPVYLTASEGNTYKPDGQIVVYGHNLCGENLSFGDSERIYWHDGEEWIFNPYGQLFAGSLLVFREGGHRVLSTFYLNRDNPDDVLLGQYRYEKVFEGKSGDIYECYFDFYIE